MKFCANCQAQRPNEVVLASPLSQKLGLTKKETKMVGEAHEPADGAAAEQQEEAAEEENYLKGLKEMQETAIRYKHPKADIDDRAANIHRLEANIASRATKSTSDISLTEHNHELKYQKEMKPLKE